MGQAVTLDRSEIDSALNLEPLTYDASGSFWLQVSNFPLMHIPVDRHFGR